MTPQPEYKGEFRQANVLDLTAADLLEADFITASSPCEQFSVHCMKHFHPNPKPPDLGTKLFRHTEHICIASGKPYIMENVRCAEKFVGKSVNHFGPFYVWGNAVPAIMPPDVYKVKKGMDIGSGSMKKKLTKAELREYRKKYDIMWTSSKSAKRKEMTSHFATIPIEIADAIARTVS